jgi:hypothetical protein
LITNWSELAALQFQAIINLVCLSRTIASVVLDENGRRVASAHYQSWSPFHSNNKYRHSSAVTWQRTRTHAYMTAYAYLASWGALIIWQACLLPPLADLQMAHALLQLAVDVLGYGYIFVTLTQPNQHTISNSVRYAGPLLAVIVIISSICNLVYDNSMSSGHKALLLIETVLVCQVWNMSLALPFDSAVLNSATTAATTNSNTDDMICDDNHALLRLSHSSSLSGLSIQSDHDRLSVHSPLRSASSSIGSIGSSKSNNDTDNDHHFNESKSPLGNAGDNNSSSMDGSTSGTSLRYPSPSLHPSTPPFGPVVHSSIDSLASITITQ